MYRIICSRTIACITRNAGRYYIVAMTCKVFLHRTLLIRLNNNPIDTTGRQQWPIVIYIFLIVDCWGTIFFILKKSTRRAGNRWLLKGADFRTEEQNYTQSCQRVFRLLIDVLNTDLRLKIIKRSSHLWQFQLYSISRNDVFLPSWNFKQLTVHLISFDFT